MAWSRKTIVQPWDQPTCANCSGEWSRNGGRTVTVGDFRYRICADCVKRRQIGPFVRAKRGER
jgi:hypothetical protein